MKKLLKHLKRSKMAQKLQCPAYDYTMAKMVDECGVDQFWSGIARYGLPWL